MALLADKVAIITGAGHRQGIGAAIARAFAGAGAAVALTDLPAQAAELQALADELDAGPGRAVPVTLDVTDAVQIRAAVERVSERFGRVDILVNNAGIGSGAPGFLEQTASDFERTFAVNVLGMVQCAQAVLPQMRARRDGVIINIASVCGLRAVPAIPASYTGSKFAVVGISKAIALEFGGDNIRCNAICPGSVDTQMRRQALELLAAAEGLSREQAEAAENATIALGRPARPAEIAALALFLASPQAAYINGAAIPVDGGMNAGL